LPPDGYRCATRAPSTDGHRGDVSPGHKRDRRFEILFGIARLPPGRRRTELEETGRQFLAIVRCEPVPERAADFYASVKLARRERGLTLDENDLWVAATALALGATLVSRDSDFGGIDGLAVVALT